MTFIQKLSNKNIVKKYIKDYEASEDNVHRSQTISTLDRLVRSDPARAWGIILDLVAVTANESLLAFLAAGPIEDLLVHHPEMIDKIEHDSLIDEKLCGVLDCVWKNGLPDETWTRLQRIVDRQYKDLILEMQRILKVRGYDIEGEEGYTGPKTREAVKRLRKVTGKPLASVEEIVDELHE
ncbi:MAG: peptidoglycan-binding domain-containing protein [Patescibacteria group bacterium]